LFSCLKLEKSSEKGGLRTAKKSLKVSRQGKKKNRRFARERRPAERLKFVETVTGCTAEGKGLFNKEREKTKQKS